MKWTISEITRKWDRRLHDPQLFLQQSEKTSQVKKVRRSEPIGGRCHLPPYNCYQSDARTGPTMVLSPHAEVKGTGSQCSVGPAFLVIP
ncbi:hypothetical protein FKM82_016493 [Ascaphus truei]